MNKVTRDIGYTLFPKNKCFLHVSNMYFPIHAEKPWRVDVFKQVMNTVTRDFGYTLFWKKKSFHDVSMTTFRYFCKEKQYFFHASSWNDWECLSSFVVLQNKQ